MGIGFTQALDKGHGHLYDGGRIAPLAVYKGHSEGDPAECWIPGPMDHFAVWILAGKRCLMRRVVASYWEQVATIGKDKP